MVMPKRRAKVGELVAFYLNSRAFARLSGTTQKQYEKHLECALDTRIEGKRLEDYQARTLKARHTNQATQVSLSWLLTITLKLLLIYNLSNFQMRIININF